MYDNKIMVIKEPRDGSHFYLFCPKEELVYRLVNIDEIKPIPITSEILEKKKWIDALSHIFIGLSQKRMFEVEIVKI